MDPSTTLSPGHKAREDEYRARYIDVIRSCYSSYPEAVSYYEQLEDHIHRGSLRRRSDWPLLQVIKPFDVLLLRDIQSYPAVAPFKMAGEGYERKTPRIEVIEGYPSPDCIASLGARWNIRPEFFMEHIVPEHKLFEVPTLPSFQGNIIRIPFASVIRAFIDRPGLEGLARRRSEIENFRRLNEKKMFQDRRYGATRYRQINIHDNYISSVEQLVSLTVAKDGDSWCLIALTDQGRIPEADECLPWKRYSQYDGRIIGELPIIPYNHAVGSTLRERRPHKASGSAASVSHDPSASNAAAGPSSGRPVEGEASIAEAQHQHDISAPQPAVPVVEAALPLPLRRVSLLSAAEHSQLVADPFFLVASLVTTSALSWSQLLNVIVDRLAVARMQRAMYAGEDDDGSSTPDLVYAGVAATKGPRNRRRASAGRMEEGKSERVGGGGGEGADETRRRTSRTNIKVDHARQRPTMRQQLENLQYHIGILQRVQAAIDSNLELVRRGGLCDTWAADIISDSHNDNDEETDTTADAASTAATGKAAAILKRRRPLQARLTRDLESLSRRCAAAVRECESGMAALMSLGQLVSAEGARAEAREVTRLTYVAFVFVPCTWAASVFQMDLDAWRDRDRAVSFAAAAVVALLFLALVFSGLLDLAGERMRRLWVAVRKRARWWWMWG